MISLVVVGGPSPPVRNATSRSLREGGASGDDTFAHKYVPAKPDMCRKATISSYIKGDIRLSKVNFSPKFDSPKLIFRQNSTL